MEMEQWLWRDIEKRLNTTSTTTALSLQTLSSIRSLITNSTTSDATITSLFQTLSHLTLSYSFHHQTHLHIISLLSQLSLTRPHISYSLSLPFTTLLSSSFPRLAAATLSLLLSFPAFDFHSVDDTLLISLSFRPCISVRVWFLHNAARFNIQPNLLLTVLLGFTKDPYPNVREAALIALARLCHPGIVIHDSDVVDLCYFRAVHLLSDPQDYVRQAAVRCAGEWGRMIATLKQEGHQRDWFDFVFLQICSTVRDMNVKVRVEAFTALGKFTCVSEDILLQALSKKVLVKVKDKQNLALRSARQCKIHIANAAGAFIHGLEDEFSEVQQAACATLRMLPVVSGQFAGEVFNIVSYVLNDDSIIVRLEALKTLHYMAVSGCLKMQEEHIEMLLGTLVDSCLHIRSEAMHIVGSVKMPSLKLSKMTVESLLECLDMYPKSEADIFRALFGVGQNNGDHSVGIVDNFNHEVEPCGDGKFGYNNHRVAGLIVLAVSASLKHENFRRRIPKKIFSYAAAFFGRISHAFADIIDADSLLQYLSQCGDLCSEAQSESVCQPVVGSASKDQLQTPVLILDAVNFISASVTSLWGLVKCGCTSEVLRALRCCKGSLKTIIFEPNEFTGAVAFVLQYIHIMKLIAKIWENFVTSRKCNFNQIGQLDILFAKLEESLLGFKFRFIGLEKEDELYILELILLSYVMVLSSFHMHCTILRKLGTIITLLEDLRSTKSTVFSDFLNQISDSFSKDDISISDPSTLKKLRDSFVLRDLTLSQRIKQVKAELVIIGSDPVTPLRFIPGLPVGVPLEMTLYNVTSDHVLWLKLTFGDNNTEFVFLDIEEIDHLQEMRQVKFSSPFYGTPRAKAFTLRVSIGIECNLYESCPVKGHGGPEHALTYISPEMDVYFVHY